MEITDQLFEYLIGCELANINVSESEQIKNIMQNLVIEAKSASDDGNSFGIDEFGDEDVTSSSFLIKLSEFVSCQKSEKMVTEIINNAITVLKKEESEYNEMMKRWGER